MSIKKYFVHPPDDNVLDKGKSITDYDEYYYIELLSEDRVFQISGDGMLASIIKDIMQFESYDLALDFIKEVVIPQQKDGFHDYSEFYQTWRIIHHKSVLSLRGGGKL